VKVSEKGIDLIKYFEGVRATPYKCPGGYWTIGVGHLISRGSELPSEWNRTLSDDEIDELLKHDLERFELGVIRLLRPSIPTQSEFDALVSFSFNLGLGCFQRSTVRSAFKRGDKKRAGEVLLKYCRAGGRKLKGLIRRRFAEHALLMSKG
jgi:lysozyme|tara:strand:+ start:280 stop:732 length:453 start_codon:yes stop_codon:yes gene_type:complete